MESHPTASPPKENDPTTSRMKTNKKTLPTPKSNSQLNTPGLCATGLVLRLNG